MPGNEPAVVVKNLYKNFRLPHEQHSGLKQLLVNFYKRRKGYEVQQVLNNISFEVKKGEFFGIVGKNGSGKSTLLKLLAGIYVPDQGLVQVNGTLSPFIELGVGFNPELTGRENVFLNGALLGFSRKDMEAMYDDIVTFAELERFMDQKLKNYSSGMQVRLAFSIAIRAKSDILLIDEVLAVGDAAFQAKCFDYFQELKKSDTTVVFVSHDRAALERFCTNGVLINDGEMLQLGPIQQVLYEYSKIVMAEIDTAATAIATKNADDKNTIRQTNQYAVIERTMTTTANGVKQKQFTYGENIVVQYRVRVKKRIVNPIMGVTIFQKNVDKAIFATNTLIEGVPTGVLNAGDVLTFKVDLPSGLNDGEYLVEPAIASESATVFYDQQPSAATFYINGSKNPYSILSNEGNSTLKLKKER